MSAKARRRLKPTTGPGQSRSYPQLCFAICAKPPSAFKFQPAAFAFALAFFDMVTKMAISPSASCRFDRKVRSGALPKWRQDHQSCGAGAALSSQRGADGPTSNPTRTKQVFFATKEPKDNSSKPGCLVLHVIMRGQSSGNPST